VPGWRTSRDALDPMTIRLAIIFQGLLLAVATAGVAVAAPVDEANALIAKGNALRRAGDDLGALPLLQQAYKINPGPRTAVQLGMAEHALGRWADADQHLTEALKLPDDPWIKRNQKQIVESLRIAKSHVGRVEITGDPPGADVLVNGRTVGQLPLAQPIAVSAGNVDVEVRAPGYQSRMRTITVAGNQYQPVVIRLAKESVASAVATVGTARAAPGLNRGSPQDSVESVRDDVAGPPPSRWRPVTVGLTLGGAALGLGLGGYGFWQYNHHATAFNKRGCFETKTGAAVGANGLTDGTCARSMTDYRNARVLEIAGFAVAGAFSTATLLVYFLGPDHESFSARLPNAAFLACLPVVPHAGIGCVLTF
jgi:hypothetical protein